MAVPALLLCSSLLFIREAAGDRTCKPVQTRCSPSGPEVRFPFGLNSTRCAYPGFTLSCNRRHRTVLTLPNTSAEFTVQSIDYASQTVFIKDPESCLPRRFLDSSFDLSGSPFLSDLSSGTFKFFNCTSNVTVPVGWRRVRCLTSDNHTVWASPGPRFSHLRQPCLPLHEVSVPVLWTPSSDGETRLQWNVPDCRSCEYNGGICRFKSDTDRSFACFTQERKGLPRALKYGITVGLGIPSLLCFIGVTSCLLSRVKAYIRGRRHPDDIELVMSVVLPQPAVMPTGLDEPTIESYPKTILGESRRLPNTNDNTCAICLSEYEPKDAIKTIPECNHYFHADCIDEWLRMNATCPLCRKTPESSNIVTPSSSISSSSSTLSPR